MAKKLTPLQEKFAEFRAAGFSRYSSALKAGYSQKSAANMGSRLDAYPEIIALVAKHKMAKEKADVINTAWAVNELVDTYRKAKESNQNAAAISALALLVKHTGGFDGGDQAQTTNYNLILAGLTPEEVRLIAKQQLPSENSRNIVVDTPMEDVIERSN